MSYPPELELVDQLLGGSMALPVVCGLFENDAHARRVLAAYVSNGVVVLSDEDGNLPAWKCQEVFRNSQPLSGYTKVRVVVTEKGAKSFEVGGWNRL
jgi:hypothetical protein